MRYRTLIGCAVILVFLAAWIIAAIHIADHLPDNQIVKLIYFVVAGMGWGVPILPLMRWMARDK